MQVLWNICLPTILISLSSIGQALAAHIAFNQESCTPDILPFVEAEVRNALDLVRQTAAWIHPPLYNENIESNIEDLFGSPRPFGESEFDPVNFPRKVFAPDWPDNSYGRGLMGFNTTFVDESELKDEWDLLIFCAPIQFSSDGITEDVEEDYGQLIPTEMYWDSYYREWTRASIIDKCRSSSDNTVGMFVGHDDKREQPDVLTLCPSWLDEARMALFPDTGTISTDGMRSRISAWRSYPQLAYTYDNIAEVDQFKMINHVLVHEFTHTWQALSAIPTTWDEITDLESAWDHQITDFSYGWADCREISENIGVAAPERNADTYTYLTIAIDLYVNMQSLVTTAGAVINAI